MKTKNDELRSEYPAELIRSGVRGKYVQRPANHEHGIHHAVAMRVVVADDALVVELRDGRTLSVPIHWYPRLEHATPAERAGWALVGRGTGIHWESIDEDISVQALIAGKASNESPVSLKRWLAKRRPMST
jgi:hypothetical protein